MDSLELSVRLSRLRLSSRRKKPPLYPDYENGQTLGSSGASAIQVWLDTDSGFASPAQISPAPALISPSPAQISPAPARLLSSPPPSPSPTTPAADGELKPMESTAENDECLSVCSSASATAAPAPAASGRQVPLFSVNSQDCSSTCSIVRLNIPPPTKSSRPTPPLPPRCRPVPPPLPPKPQSQRHLPRKLL